MWAQHEQLSPIPAPADSPPSGGWPPPSELSFGGAVSEKSGLEGFSGAFARNLSLLTQLMPKRSRDAEEEKGDFQGKARLS